MMKLIVRRLLWLSLIVGGCYSPPDDDGDGRPVDRFIARPVQVVVNDTFSRACTSEIEMGWHFIRAQGVSTSLVSAPVDFPGFRGIPVPGTITVMQGELGSEPGYDVLGEARVARTPILGGIVAALITLDSCEARVFAHEMGHALGLTHENSPQNLMHSDYSLGGWGLTAEQVLWIAD